MSPGPPPIYFLLPLLLLAMSVVALVYSVRMFLRHQSTPGPQQSRQIARIALGPLIAAIAIMLWMGLVRPEKRAMSFLMCLPIVVVTLRFAWLVFHTPTEDDAIANFAHDREHCGRCGYSVTGNITGVCPECAWAYPTGDLPAEEPDWSAWWRKWQIHYLRHYVWHLSSYIGIALFCFAMAALFYSQGNLPSAAVLALLGIHLSINAVRVIDYLRRRRPHRASPFSPG